MIGTVPCRTWPDKKIRLCRRKLFVHHVVSGKGPSYGSVCGTIVEMRFRVFRLRDCVEIGNNSLNGTHRDSRSGGVVVVVVGLFSVHPFGKVRLATSATLKKNSKAKV